MLGPGSQLQRPPERRARQPRPGRRLGGAGRLRRAAPPGPARRGGGGGWAEPLHLPHSSPGASEKGIRHPPSGTEPAGFLSPQTPKLLSERTGAPGQPPALLTLSSSRPPSLPARSQAGLPGFLQHTEPIPAPGPWHLPSPPPGCFFLGIRVSAQCPLLGGHPGPPSPHHRVPFFLLKVGICQVPTFCASTRPSTTADALRARRSAGRSYSPGPWSRARHRTGRRANICLAGTQGAEQVSGHLASRSSACQRAPGRAAAPDGR